MMTPKEPNEHVCDTDGVSDGIPTSPADETPTARIRVDTVWREPDFDDEEPTLVPTGGE